MQITLSKLSMFKIRIKQFIHLYNAFLYLNKHMNVSEPASQDLFAVPATLWAALPKPEAAVATAADLQPCPRVQRESSQTPWVTPRRSTPSNLLPIAPASREFYGKMNRKVTHPPVATQGSRDDLISVGSTDSRRISTPIDKEHGEAVLTISIGPRVIYFQTLSFEEPPTLPSHFL